MQLVLLALVGYYYVIYYDDGLVVWLTLDEYGDGDDDHDMTCRKKENQNE